MSDAASRAARPPDPTAALLIALERLRALQDAAERAGDRAAVDRLDRQVQRLSFRLIGLRNGRIWEAAGSAEAAALLQALGRVTEAAESTAARLEQADRLTRAALDLLAALERRLMP